MAKVKLGSILKESRIISEKPNPNKRIKVKLKVLGVVKRGVENEVEGATKQFVRKAGQFIFGKQNFHKGAFGVIPEELDGFESSSDLPAFEIDSSCLSEYLFYFFKSGNYYLELSKIAYGVATQRINMKEFYDLEIPLPKIEKQGEIVSKLKLLENEGSKIDQELISQLSLVKQLRQAFLSEAMQGKMVTAPSSSEREGGEAETGQQLLARIKAEKGQLIKDKKLKKEKELLPIKSEEIPFEIPKDWVWCRLGEVIELSSGQDLSPSEYSDVNEVGIPYITGASNLQNGKVFVNRWTNKPKAFAINDDLLLTCKGSGIGKMAYLKFDKVHIARQIMGIRSRFISVKYVHLILSNNVDNFRLNAKSLIPGIDRPQVLNLLIPLPPLSFQNQIVAKLDELMKTCDDLENSIKQSQLQNEQLLQQVLKEALEVRDEVEI